MVESVGGAEGAGAKAKVAGLCRLWMSIPAASGVLHSFRNNGVEQHVKNWASGAQPQATPEQIQAGLGNTGLINRVAAKAGVSPQTSQVARNAPADRHSHFKDGSRQASPQSGFGGRASQILGRLIWTGFRDFKGAMMADFQALPAKYAPVVDTIKKFEPYGAKFVGSELVGEQYHLVAQVPSKVVLDRVWDAIKQADAQYADLKHEITNTGGDEDQYTLQSGETLSKVSQLYYGNPNKYEAIAKASGLADANKVPAGQVLTIPAL